ncbi:hypothetical protein B6N25_03985 [Sphingobacteriales bacterium TSM_CSS]|nr:hypothetical protein B6N25_03985 [Sphingobacteriales bacterium TSM_CSS]
MKKQIFLFIVAVSALAFTTSCNNAAKMEEMKAQQQQEIDKMVNDGLANLRAELSSACNAQVEGAIAAKADSIVLAAATAKAGTAKPTTNTKPKPKPAPTPKPAPAPTPKPKTTEEKMQDVRGNAAVKTETKTIINQTPEQTKERMKNVRGNATKVDDKK